MVALSIEVNGRTVRTFGIVHYIVGVRCWGEDYTSIPVFDAHINITAGCGEPTPASRGFIDNFQSAEEGSTITYSCSPGLVPRTLMSAVCTNMTWRPDPATFQCREPLPGELGKYDIVGDFRWRKRSLICEKYDFCWENFCRLLTFATPKDATPQNFTEKTFTNSHNTAKFAKVFSLKSLPL